jgi:hypothetical protein
MQKKSEVPTFVDVARTIAKGEPPEWLAVGLAYFSDHYVGVTLAKAGMPSREGELERVMLEAAKLLAAGLPMYALEADTECPLCVEDMVQLLPDVIEFLEGDVAEFDAIPPRKGGPRPDLRRPVAAAVCAEAWRVLHEQIEPYSQHLQAACEEYWRACGNPETSTVGRIKNWQDYLLLVKDQDNEWIRNRFGAPPVAPLTDQK